MTDLWSGRSDLQEISDRVFITNFFGAKNKKKLKEKQITHVLIAAKELPKIFENDDSISIEYFQIDLVDNATKVEIPFEESLLFIEKSLKLNEKNQILVHCAAGSSRSGTIAIAWLMKHEKLNLKDALKKAQTIRPIILPNPGFVEQLQNFQKSLNASSSSSSPSS